MTKAEYLYEAEECERMAPLVSSEDARRKMLKIAAGWRELAARPGPDREYATDPSDIFSVASF